MPTSSRVVLVILAFWFCVIVRLLIYISTPVTNEEYWENYKQRSRSTTPMVGWPNREPTFGNER